MCKVVRDVQQVTDLKQVVELSAKGYEMFFAPVVDENNELVYTLTLREEVDQKEYDKTVKKTLAAL